MRAAGGGSVRLAPNPHRLRLGHAFAGCARPAWETAAQSIRTGFRVGFQMDSLDASLAALRAPVLRLRLSGANAISSLPLLSPRSRLSHTDGDDEENEQNR